MCAPGTPWRFFVRPGSSNRVVVEYQGGGSCWSGETCSTPGQTFVDYLRVPPAVESEATAAGILDHANPDNPFRDWHHVFVPYCTGDQAWGDSDTEYTASGKTFTVHHRGAVNAQSVLDWLKENLAAPEEVFVSGSSAGSYASIMWAPHLARQYPKAKLTQFGDCGVGVVSPVVVPAVLEHWNAAASFPDFIPGADISKIDSMPKLYQLVAQGYPDAQLSELTTRYDQVQVSYFKLMGGSSTEEWATKALTNLDEAEKLTPSFRSYVAPGSEHTFLELSRFYSVEAGGVRLLDWVDALRARAAQSVRCDPDCGEPAP